MASEPVRAAQYLRMSTEHQRYSTANQAAAIAVYAELRGYEITETYADEGRSGLNLKGRPALARLIQDVVSGTASFSTILVYDVSRWGRFQDADESAHYEFLCRQAGISVHYCAEGFENDGAVGSNLLKSIKRIMAGEYSRELSVKTAAGQRRITTMGYRMGGSAGLGLRRWMVDPNGRLKGPLELYEQKSIQTYRTVLRPGPPEEVALVNRIFRMFAREHLSEWKIAKTLNDEGLTTDLGRRWTRWSVQLLLKAEKYVGTHVWGRASYPLKGPKSPNAKDTWVVVENAFEPIVPRRLFEDAQAIFKFRSALRKSDDVILDRLAKLLKREGYLSMNLIQADRTTPAALTYIARFGSMEEAYRRIGYAQPAHYRDLHSKRRLRLKYAGASKAVLRGLGFGNAGNRIEWLRFPDGRTFSLIIARRLRYHRGGSRWAFNLPDARPDVTVVARLDETQEAIHDFLVLGPETPTKRIQYNSLEGRDYNWAVCRTDSLRSLRAALGIPEPALRGQHVDCA